MPVHAKSWRGFRDLGPGARSGAVSIFTDAVNGARLVKKEIQTSIDQKKNGPYHHPKMLFFWLIVFVEKLVIV